MCPHAQNSTYTLLLLFCQSLCVFLLHVWKPPSRLPPSRKGNFCSFCSFWKISGYAAAFIQDVCTCPKCDVYHAFGLLLCCVRVMRPRLRSHGAFFFFLLHISSGTRPLIYIVSKPIPRLTMRKGACCSLATFSHLSRLPMLAKKCQAAALAIKACITPSACWVSYR